MRSGNFRLIEELIKRRVPNAVVFYAVACFVLLQIADITFEPLGIPSHYVPRMIAVMLGALPMVILLAWKLQVEGGFRIEVAQPVNPVLEKLATLASVVVLAGVLFYLPAIERTNAADVTSIEVNVSGAHDRSIAVLPFNNLSSDLEQGFLADGLTRDIADQLSMVPEFRVVPVSTIEAVVGKETDKSAYNRALDARYIVAGGLEKRGQRFRLRVSLTDGDRAQQVWSKHYDEEIRTFFEVQDDITRNIASALQIQVNLSNVRQIERGEFDLEAYHFIQLAEEARRTYSHEAANSVVSYLESALQLQPDNAEAHAFMAIQLSQNLVSRFTDNPTNTFVRMQHHLERARVLAPDDPRVLQAAGIVASMTGRHEEAAQFLSESLLRNPSDPHTRAAYGWVLGVLGDTQKGIELLEDAMTAGEHHPRYAIWAAYLAGVYGIAGDQDQTGSLYKLSVARNPYFHMAYIGKSLNHFQFSEMASAREALDTALSLACGFTFQEYEQGLISIGYVSAVGQKAWQEQITGFPAFWDAVANEQQPCQ